MSRSAEDGRWEKHSVFWYEKLDEAGTLDYFETDQSKTDTPTLSFGTVRIPVALKSGIINRIHYRLNPTEAQTYTLRLWADAVAGDYASNCRMLYESPAAQADDTDYDRTELKIPFVLALAGIMYYSLDWTAAPGNTTGFICVSGEVVE